jgi:putative nucleotidyltransferase with HDIG domain
MSGARVPPRLWTRTLAVTFTTFALLLVVVFLVVTINLRNQVRASVTAGLESSQRLFAALETRRQSDLRDQAAALDTYQIEVRNGDTGNRDQLLRTLSLTLESLATRVEGDALVLADQHGITLAATGPDAARWPAGRAVAMTASLTGGAEGIAHVGGAAFRLVAVPLTLGPVMVGTLYVATNLDQHFAEELAALAGTRIAILDGPLVIASTLSPEAARQFEQAAGSAQPVAGTAILGGESYAFRKLVDLGPATTSFYALASIDQSTRAAMRGAMQGLLLLAAGAFLLALAASLWIARLLTTPINELSGEIATLAARPDMATRLPLTGSSVELDALTTTFNDLIASVAQAEALTQAAYTGAIRALAVALDARDPYTAGHSERVSVVSVAIGRALGLPEADVEVLRLGALMHDIGKIGVPDEILRKPGGLTDAEYDAIKQHPTLGARILRSVPFLAPHLPIVELHHERPDGRGYPHGLRGDDIPLAARIVHVADAYDAMTSARAYRGAMPSVDALRELWRCAGTEFHADIVGALATALPGVIEDARPLIHA